MHQYININALTNMKKKDIHISTCHLTIYFDQLVLLVSNKNIQREKICELTC